MINQAEAKCSDCQRYNAERMMCRNDQTIRSPKSYCGDFKMKLADHYVPNVWDEWKKKAERKAAAAKVKSGGQ
ncbi:MAG: hypothetical protein IJI57_07340 [Flexilinea sp.]|nr:hypothetical protein [Flexilinea sp.]